MKKLLATLFISIVSACAFAQLKVTYDGNVYIQKTNEDDKAILNVGNISNSQLDTGLGSTVKSSIHAQNYNADTYVDCVGVLGESKKEASTSDTGFSVGVWGDADGANSARNIGVFGSIGMNKSGAAVYGSSDGYPSSFLTGSYAAYFYGDTYINGTLTTWGAYNLSDMRLKDNVVSLSQQGSALENLQKLDIISYNLCKPEVLASKAAQPVRELSEREKREVERRHYGVSAQELQKIYPDLVLEGQDGYLAVNYTELVPLLIRSVQELKTAIDEVRRNVATKR